jgi:hypothetical protein
MPTVLFFIFKFSLYFREGEFNENERKTQEKQRGKKSKIYSFKNDNNFMNSPPFFSHPKSSQEMIVF